MRRLFNILFTITLITVIVYVLANMETVSDWIMDRIFSVYTPIIEESNEYRRDYKYNRYSYFEDYIPLSKKHVENIFFNVLNNGWDDFIYYCPREYETCANDIADIADDTTLLSKINNYVSPYNSFDSLDTIITDEREILIRVHKTYTDEEIEFIDKEIEKLYVSLKLENKNPLQQIESVHNYILESVVYDDTFDENKINNKYKSNTAVGALLSGYAICSGYADSFALFMDRLGIPNLKVSSEDHVWNLIYYRDSWMHIDLTWDDDETNSDNRRNYFMITTSELNDMPDDAHEFDETFFIESKNLTKSNS